MNTASIHEEANLGRVYDQKLVGRLLTYVKPYTRTVIISLVLLLIGAGLEQLMPYLTKRAIDNHIAKNDFSGLIWIVLTYLGVALVVTGARIAQTLITGRVGENVMYDLRREVFHHLQTQDSSFFDRNPVGRLVTRVTSDVQTLSEIFSSGIVVVLGDLLTLIAIMIAMFWMNWQLALVAISVIPLLFFASLYFRLKLRDAFRDVRVRVAAINAFLQEHLAGMRLVQLFNHQGPADTNFHGVNARTRAAHLQTVALFSFFFPLMEIIGALTTALILMRGGVLILDDALTFGALVAFFQYSERFFRPIRDLTEKYNIFQAGMASAERVFNLLDTEVNIREPEAPLVCKRIEGAVQFKDVSFAYTDENYVLKDVSFAIKPGERVAIVGATGAGKTTVSNLIPRFYETTRGQVLVDDMDVRDWCLHELRSNIAIVQQDVVLFRGTIRDNITLGDDFSDEEVERAAKMLQADQFIQSLPKGYDEPVMERGATLSSGQKQLIAFTRALIRNPSVLILDEATSSVDMETEALIQQAMETLFKDRTSIVIAHRLATIRRADTILVFHKGALAEQGSHEELIAADGIYKRLYQLQYGEAA
ncbi:ATP-binding cassette domain-containing protein [bacterium]|nr:ATP-binding cassette domain-containing protein [bacterium]